VSADKKSMVEGRWVHSHEEDTAEEMVFRPADRTLPPARGRAAFELRADGTYVESEPGPVDVPVETGGRWSLEGDRLVLEGKGDRPGHAWRIAALEDDRLAVREE
jgi:hypothetical protein